MFDNWESRASKPSLRKEPAPVCVERAFPPLEVTTKSVLDETMELLNLVFGASEKDSDLSAFSAALKTKPWLTVLKKPRSNISLRLKPLTRDVKSCRGICSSPMDPFCSPFHPLVTTVPICNVGDPSEAEMKSYGVVALAPLATTHPSPPTHAAGGTGGWGRGTKAIATPNLQIELPDFDRKSLQDWAEELSDFLLPTGQKHGDVKTKCTLIKKSCKKEFLQQQVKTAIT